MKIIVNQKVLPVGAMDYFAISETFELEKEKNVFELACGELIACQVKDENNVEVSFIRALDDKNNFELFNTINVCNEKVEMFNGHRVYAGESLLVYIEK